MTTIRAMRESDFAWVLALSAENEIETSHLDAATLRAMMMDAFVADVAEASPGLELMRRRRPWSRQTAFRQTAIEPWLRSWQLFKNSASGSASKTSTSKRRLSMPSHSSRL